MKSVITRLSVLALLALSAFAQTSTPVPPTVTSLFGSLGSLINQDTPIPAHLFGAGVGIQQGFALNGALRACTTKGLNMACAVTRYSGGTSTGSVEGDQVLVAQHGFIFHIHGQLGVAIGGDGSKGGAYDLGSGLSYNVSRLPVLKKHPGYWVSLFFDWDKRDVNDFVSQSGTLQGLAGAWRPFVSKTSLTAFLQKEF